MFGGTVGRVEAFEFLDNPKAYAADIPANLADIRLLNRRFGATKLMLQSVEALTGDIPAFSLLDVATGSADIPLALHHRFGVERITITALDSSPKVLGVARSVVGDAPVSLVHGDARLLPFPDASFDLVTCSLALHHFAPGPAEKTLREMYRVARRAVLVSDLVRSRLAYACVWALSRTVARNRLTRHDAPLSVLRSYTNTELLELAQGAGIENPRLRNVAFFRQLLVLEKEQY